MAQHRIQIRRSRLKCMCSWHRHRPQVPEIHRRRSEGNTLMQCTRLRHKEFDSGPGEPRSHHKRMCRWHSLRGIRRFLRRKTGLGCTMPPRTDRALHPLQAEFHPKMHTG